MSTLRTGLILCTLQLGGCGGCNDDGGGGRGDDTPDGSVPTVAVTLTVLDPNARSCEVTLSEQGWEVSRVTYSANITGDWDRSAPRVALAFTRAEDQALGQALELELTQKGGNADDYFASVETTCFDRLGTAIEGADVQVE